MASDRQIAANRRNTKRSTGPRTQAGKRRARANAYRHGLSSRPISTIAAAEQVEELARAISGGQDSALIHEWANTAAEAILDLARVRKTRDALMGKFVPQQPAKKSGEQISDQISALSDQANVLDAISRLRAFDRYERRFAGRRDRAIRKIVRYTRTQE